MRFFCSIVLILLPVLGIAQTTNDVLNVLVEGNAISQAKADSLRAEYSIRQQSNLPDKKLRIDFEFRPRSEFRNGYQQLRNDTTVGAFFINQRIVKSAGFFGENISYKRLAKGTLNGYN
jgi:hypothetical protein